MSFMSIGAVILVIIIIFIFSRVWFNFVEGILSVLKRLFSRKAEDSEWFSLPDKPNCEANKDLHD